MNPAGQVVEEARITSFVPPEEAARLFRLAGLRPVKNEDLLAGFDQPASNQEERIP